MLEKLEFQRLVEETLTVKRIPRVMTVYQFVLAMVLAIYVGFSRLNHLRFVAQPSDVSASSYIIRVGSTIGVAKENRQLILCVRMLLAPQDEELRRQPDPHRPEPLDNGMAGGRKRNHRQSGS